MNVAVARITLVAVQELIVTVNVTNARVSHHRKVDQAILFLPKALFHLARNKLQNQVILKFLLSNPNCPTNYIGSRLMGSLWDRDKWIPITD
jgi:hypothetical protein